MLCKTKTQHEDQRGFYTLVVGKLAHSFHAVDKPFSLLPSCEHLNKSKDEQSKKIRRKQFAERHLLRIIFKDGCIFVNELTTQHTRF